jgi:hypothetical protein
MQSASYAVLAANEAEKAARMIDYRMIAAGRRLCLSGSEADVRHAAGPPKTRSET